MKSRMRQRLRVGALNLEFFAASPSLPFFSSADKNILSESLIPVIKDDDCDAELLLSGSAPGIIGENT